MFVFPEGGWAEGGLRDAGWHLPLAARVFISRREDARGGGGGSSWQGCSRKVGDGVMTQDERRNPSRHRIEEHDMLNWNAAGPVMPGPRCLLAEEVFFSGIFLRIYENFYYFCIRNKFKGTMLAKFAVKNFRGFADKIELDLTRHSNYSFNLCANNCFDYDNGVISTEPRGSIY